MKKLKSLYLLLLIIAGFVSCSKDFIDLEPKTNKLEGNFYKTEADAFLALTAVYDALVVQNWQFVPVMADIKSDDAFAGGDQSGTDMIQYQEQERFAIDKENAAVSALWNRCYSGIYRANLLLEKSENIAWESEVNKIRIISEAKFLRAYFYWDLARHYGWSPILTHVEANPDVLANLPQATPAEVYKQIAADLIEARAGLPATVPASQAGRVTKHAVSSLMARIYLYYEGFVKPVLGVTEGWGDGTTSIDKAYVKTALDEVITSGAYRLLPNYADVFSWTNENNDEDIFSFQYDGQSASDDWGGWGVNGNFTSIFIGPRDPAGDPTIVAGWSFSPLTFSLVAEFEANDPRKGVTVYDATAKLSSYTRGFQNTGYFNKKFMALKAFEVTKGTAAHNYLINYPDIRYADVLLMASEIYLADDAPKALNYFNMVRTRAMGPTAAKASITMDDIFHERRVELAGEGHRYWDMLRRNLTYAGQNINNSFKNIPTGNPMINAADFTARNFDANSFGMFPIPAGEIRLTSNNLKQFVPAYQ